MSEAAEAATDEWAREYETIYILKPNVDPDEAQKLADRIQEIMSSMGGRLLRVDSWGKRRLAYIIRKHSRGIFIYLKYLGLPGLVAELERNLRLVESVIRYQTIVLEGRHDLKAVEIDPEEVQFERIEQSDEADEEMGLAERLGLVPRASYDAEGEGDDDDMDDDDLGVDTERDDEVAQ